MMTDVDDGHAYLWRVHTRLPERFGMPCRLLVKARRMNSVLVQFEDGLKVVTSLNYIRRRANAGMRRAR